MGAIIVGLRPGDHADLKQMAEQIGRPAKEVAGILLEQAIRRTRGRRLVSADHPNSREAGALT